jgi:hypothetical protein
MRVAGFWEKAKPAVCTETPGRRGSWAEWIVYLKTTIAEIASAKGSQQFGREEEMEK